MASQVSAGGRGWASAGVGEEALAAVVVRQHAAADEEGEDGDKPEAARQAALLDLAGSAGGGCHTITTFIVNFVFAFFADFVVFFVLFGCITFSKKMCVCLCFGTEAQKAQMKHVPSCGTKTFDGQECSS